MIGSRGLGECMICENIKSLCSEAKGHPAFKAMSDKEFNKVKSERKRRLEEIEIEALCWWGIEGKRGVASLRKCLVEFSGYDGFDVDEVINRLVLGGKLSTF